MARQIVNNEAWLDDLGWLDDLDAALRDPDGEEYQGDALVALAFAGGRSIEIEEHELNGAIKRSMFVLAAGGDPARGIDLGGRAVETIADDLDSPSRRAILVHGLRDLRARAAQRTAAVDLLAALEADEDMAWRAFAASRMAQRLAQDG